MTVLEAAWLEDNIRIQKPQAQEAGLSYRVGWTRGIWICRSMAATAHSQDWLCHQHILKPVLLGEKLGGGFVEDLALGFVG